MSSELQLDVRHLSRWRRHLVNAYEVRQTWCLLQVKLCDPSLSALKWFVCHARRYTSALLLLLMTEKIRRLNSYQMYPVLSIMCLSVVLFCALVYRQRPVSDSSRLRHAGSLKSTVLRRTALRRVPRSRRRRQGGQLLVHCHCSRSVCSPVTWITFHTWLCKLVLFTCIGTAHWPLVMLIRMLENQIIKNSAF